MDQILLLVALLLPASLGMADDHAPPSGQPATVSAESVREPSPELTALYRSLTEAQVKQKDGRLTAEGFQEWARSYRAKLDETMTHVPPTSANAALHAEILSRLGDTKQALSRLDGALKNDPNNPKLIAAKGYAYFDSKDYVGAATAADAALQIDPRNKEALWLKYASENRVPSSVRLPGTPWGAPDQSSEPGPDAMTPGSGVHRGWTASDYARANDEARRQTAMSGGKIDRGVPPLSTIGSEVVANTPLGPLIERSSGQGKSDPLRTAGTLALSVTGALLLFGGLGGKQLDEKLPGVRKSMGVAALVGGTLATGAIAWEAYAARAAVAAIPVAANPEIESEAGQVSSEASALETKIVTDGAIPRSAAQGARLQEHLRQLQKYGTEGYRELENGSIRYYGELRQARTTGDMTGMRLVREWNPAMGMARTWMETVDRAGVVRIVRPETGAEKVHYYFNEAGEYLGSK